MRGELSDQESEAEGPRPRRWENPPGCWAKNRQPAVYPIALRFRYPHPGRLSGRRHSPLAAAPAIVRRAAIHPKPASGPGTRMAAIGLVSMSHGVFASRDQNAKERLRKMQGGFRS